MAAPLIYPEDPADEFDWATDWQEAIGDQAPGATVDFSPGQQEATLTGYVDFNKERDALKKIVGYSYADTAAPWGLHRVLPQRHPRYPQLVAYAASASALQPQSQDTNVSGEPYLESPFEANSYYATYAKSLLTVRFKSFGRVKFLPDDRIEEGEEMKRYTTLLPAPTVQTIQRQGGAQLKFVEGDAATAGPDPGPPPAPTGGNLTWTADLPELVPQANLVLKWYGVPHEYVSADPDVLYPTKIMNLLGCVNSVDFYLSKFPVGSVLLMSATFADTLFPVSTTDPDEPATGYDIEFGLLYSPRESSAPGSTKRGHQLFPYWVGGGAGGGPAWLNAVRENNGAFLREDNLNEIFSHIGS